MTNDKKNLVLGICFTAFTVVTGLASIFGLPESKATLKTLLLIIAVVSLILSSCFFLSTRIRIISAYNLLKNSKDLGIFKLHPTGISDDTLTSKIRNSKVIKIFFATGIAFFRTREDDLIKAFFK